MSKRSSSIKTNRKRVTMTRSKLDWEPIAARTRLKLGSPMKKVIPVQYPNTWPLLQQVEMLSNVDKDSIKLRAGERYLSTRNLIEMAKFLKEPVETSKLSKKRGSKAAKGMESNLIGFLTSGGNGRKRVQFSKLQRLLRCSMKNKRTARKRERSRAKKRKRTKRGRSKKSKRSASKRRPGKTRRRKNNRSTRRKKSTAQRRKKKNQKTASKRRRKPRRPKYEMPEYNYTLEPEKPYGHANDANLKLKQKIPERGIDAGNDVIKDDPLNVTNLCRSLVKSMPGAPADARENNVDEQWQPERERHNIKTIWDTRGKILEDSDEESRDGEKNNNRPVQKTTKPKRLKRVDIKKMRVNKHSSSKTSKLVNRRAKKRQTKIRYINNTFHNDIRTIRRKRLNGRLKNVSGVVPKADVKASKAVDEKKNKPYKLLPKKRPKSNKTMTMQSKFSAKVRKKKTPSPLKPVDNEQEPVGKDIESVQRKPIVKLPKSKPTRIISVTPSNVVYSDDKQLANNQPCKKAAPYCGKPVPRNRRKEDINIIKKQGNRIGKLVKRVSASAKRMSQNKKPKKPETKQRKGQQKQRQVSSQIRSRKATIESTRGAKGRKRRDVDRYRHRRPNGIFREITLRKHNSSADDGRNKSSNNFNNNQGEITSWGRVGNRLFRIGVYLLRKFRIFG